MPDKKYWYVLFARTGVEERLTERLKDNFDSNIFQPFIPQKTCVFRRHGKKSLFQKICFPGYVFIESVLPSEQFIRQSFPIIFKQKEAYRFLCYGEKSDIAMRDDEQIALNRVFGKDRRIDMSVGFKEGDSVRVISGPLEGSESIIARINKNRHEAIIDIAMFGAIVQVSVGIEFLEKISDAPMLKGARENE